MSLKGRTGEEGDRRVGTPQVGGREEGKNFTSCFPSANLKEKNTKQGMCLGDKNPKGFKQNAIELAELGQKTL